MIETEHLPVTKRSPYRSVSDKKILKFEIDMSSQDMKPP